jgi:4-hydroxy-tetrahydrodipicolinate synthase
MVAAVDAGELETARDISATLAPVCDALMGGGQGAVMAKAALALQGHIDHPTVRSPLVEANHAELTDLRTAMVLHGLLKDNER